MAMFYGICLTLVHLFWGSSRISGSYFPPVIKIELLHLLLQIGGNVLWKNVTDCSRFSRNLSCHFWSGSLRILVWWIFFVGRETTFGWLDPFSKKLQFSLFSINHPVTEISLRFEFTPFGLKSKDANNFILIVFI